MWFRALALCLRTNLRSAINRRTLISLASKLETLGFRFKARAKNLGVERILETVTHEGRIIVLDIHVELAGIAKEKIQNLAVVGELPAGKHDLIGAFLVKLAQPRRSFVRIH